MCVLCQIYVLQISSPNLACLSFLMCFQLYLLCFVLGDWHYYSFEGICCPRMMGMRNGHQFFFTFRLKFCFSLKPEQFIPPPDKLALILLKIIDLDLIDKDSGFWNTQAIKSNYSEDISYYFLKSLFLEIRPFVEMLFVIYKLQNLSQDFFYPIYCHPPYMNVKLFKKMNKENNSSIWEKLQC